MNPTNLKESLGTSLVEFKMGDRPFDLIHGYGNVKSTTSDILEDAWPLEVEFTNDKNETWSEWYSSRGEQIHGHYYLFPNHEAAISHLNLLASRACVQGP